MTDLFLFAFFCTLLALGLRRPFLWVLAYLYVDILAPQKIGWGFFSALPVSFIAFCAAFGGWLLTDRKTDLRFTLRQSILLFILAYSWLTLQWTAYPDSAFEKWDWVWKALVFAIFLPFTITTRLRMEAAALFMVLTAGAIIITGGIKTALGGGGYGTLTLFVDDNSGIYESSTIATVAIAIVPLLFWFNRHGTIFPPDWRTRAFSVALGFACLLIPIGTEARTGLLCIAALALIGLMETRRRAMFILAGGALALAALPFIPHSYYQRMATIGGHSEDQSASTRLAVWQWTLDYAKEHPLGGGFDAYRANSFTYRMPQESVDGNTISLRYETVTDEARAYHSAIFEMLGEQGWPGLLAWLWLHALGLLHMGRIRRRWRARNGAGEQWQAPLAAALLYAQVIYLIGALFQGIAYQPFVMMLIGLQCALWNYTRRAETGWRAARRARRVSDTADETAQPAPR